MLQVSTVLKLMLLNLSQSDHPCEVEAIVDRANKDIAIESLLNTFEEVWLSRQLELRPHRRVTNTARQEVSRNTVMCGRVHWRSVYTCTCTNMYMYMYSPKTFYGNTVEPLLQTLLNGQKRYDQSQVQCVLIEQGTKTTPEARIPPKISRLEMYHHTRAATYRYH